MPNASIKMNMDFKLTQREQDRLLVYVQKEVLNQIYKNLKPKVRELENFFRGRVKTILLESPGFDELINGYFLRYNLGIRKDEAVEATGQIADIIGEDIRVELSRTKDSVDFMVRLVESDYSKIRSLPIGTFISSGGYKIDWLEWLLFRGDEIISDYRIVYTRKKPEPHSRSGGAFMITGDGWRIPPYWSSSSPEGNIIIRSFKNIHEYILITLKELI